MAAPQGPAVLIGDFAPEQTGPAGAANQCREGLAQFGLCGEQDRRVGPVGMRECNVVEAPGLQSCAVRGRPIGRTSRGQQGAG